MIRASALRNRFAIRGVSAVRSKHAATTAAAGASDNASKTIGFAGLGNMGAFMAKNLLKHGFRVVAYDINASAVASLTAAGAVGAATVADMARQSSTIITMLPATKHVSETLRGPNGVFANAPKGALIIDCSTIDPVATRALSADAKAAGHRLIDAPVSGGVGGAEKGTLTFMVGGEKRDFDDAQPVLKSMGANTVHCGSVGAGESVKLCNNLALAIQMIGTSEALALGVSLGVDPKVLASVMNTSTARCWSSDTYNPCPGVMPNVPSSRGYTGGFAVGLMRKDLGLALDAATATHASVPLGGLALQVYNILAKHGFEHKDFSSVYQYLSEKEGSRDAK